MLRIPALITEGEGRTRETRETKAEEFSSYLSSNGLTLPPSSPGSKARGDLFASRIGKSKLPWNPMFPERVKEWKPQMSTKRDSKEPFAFLESALPSSSPSET